MASGVRLNLLLEELMDAQIGRIRRARAVPCFDQQGAGLGRQHVELVHRRLRRLLERLRQAQSACCMYPHSCSGDSGATVCAVSPRLSPLSSTDSVSG